MRSEGPVTVYVEDDKHSLDVLTFILTRIMDFPAPFLFEDTQNFKTRLTSLPVVPDIIFVDIWIEPDDGYTVLNTIRNEPLYNDCAVIAISASVMTDEIQQLKAAGFNGLIAKPIRTRYLMESIPRILLGESVWIVK